MYASLCFINLILGHTYKGHPTSVNFSCDSTQAYNRPSGEADVEFAAVVVDFHSIFGRNSRKLQIICLLVVDMAIFVHSICSYVEARPGLG